MVRAVLQAAHEVHVPMSTALAKRLFVVAPVCAATLSMALPAIADTIDLWRSMNWRNAYVIHASDLGVKASALLDLALVVGERDHGKWVRLSPEDFFAIFGLLAPADADYLLIKDDGPNLGVHVFDLGEEPATLAEIGDGFLAEQPTFEIGDGFLAEQPTSGIGDGLSTEQVTSGNDSSDDPPDPVVEPGAGNEGSGQVNIDAVTVPDGGPTAILLGLSFLALGVLRRKSRNN